MSARDLPADRTADQNRRWLSVIGWEGLYEVSDTGDVRSLPRRSPWMKGRTFGGGPLKPILKKRLGYLCVTLHGRGRTKKQEMIQVLVLNAFVGQRPEGFDACHNNAIRADNRLENLRWASRAENQRDKVIHGNSLRGEKAAWAKLSEEKVKYIRTSAKTQQALADELGVSQVLISKVRLRKIWTHI